ncbi:unnamed protein product [Lupinus luteus]|uniref:Uncharacterized protein n=1 Tax=Lupinus luteus TaxID=3873 RepID=A0AAV1WMS1_LUPLU
MPNMNFNNSNELSNLQSILSHVESHVAREIVAMRRQHLPNYINSKRYLISNPTLPNFHWHQNFDNRRVLQAPENQHVPMPLANAGLFPCPTRGSASQLADTCNFSLGDMVFSQEKEMEVSMIDGTKPLIKLLEKPINNRKFTYGVNMNGGNLDMLFLDLELRL